MDLYYFAIMKGHMVTAVTVTVFTEDLALKGEGLRVARERIKANSEREGIFLPCAYTQSIVCLYANNRFLILEINRISG